MRRCVQREHQARADVEQLVVEAGVLRDHLGQIVSGGEHRAVRFDDDDLGRRRQVVERGEQCAHQLAVERVAALGSVEAEAAHLAVVLHREIVHRFRPVPVRIAQRTCGGSRAMRSASVSPRSCSRSVPPTTPTTVGDRGRRGGVRTEAPPRHDGEGVAPGPFRHAEPVERVHHAPQAVCATRQRQNRNHGGGMVASAWSMSFCASGTRPDGDRRTRCSTLICA